jgi:hypothetical protein
MLMTSELPRMARKYLRGDSSEACANVIIPMATNTGTARNQITRNRYGSRGLITMNSTILVSNCSSTIVLNL